MSPPTRPVPQAGRVSRLASLLPPALRERAARLPGTLAPPVAAGTPTPRIVIIGAGFGGLGLGARLRQAGIESFTIHEKAASVGGTWRDNTYPGAACDVPSHLYSLSFAPKTDWTRKFPAQPEILDYLEGVARDFGLEPHLRFGSEVRSATFDEGAGTWLVEFADGTSEEADVVVSATGQLNLPYTPALPGLDRFAGHAFHSARWDHDHDLAHRDVAVVGIGASAIQFVPEIAKVARSVTLFQRSVNYVAPKPDGEFSPRALALLRVPVIRRLYRASIWARFDARWLLFRSGSQSGKLVQKAFDKGIRPVVSAGLPEAAVVPDYPVGCKRLLISDDWYPTLLQPHVTVVSDPIDEVTADGVTAGGRSYPAETLVFGTGFQSTGFLTPMRVTGRGGVDLHEHWADGAEAHLGLTVAGFPNLFMLYGPNTNLGHNSIVFMIERQIAYLLTCVRALVEEEGLAWLDVRPEVEAASNRRLVAELGRTVWAANCHSWYKTASGRITNNWSGPTARYWLRTAWPKLADFEHGRPVQAGSVSADQQPSVAAVR